MKISHVVLYKSFVKPFYKQNAALFAFLIFFMVAAVGRANEVGLLEYHLALIKAMMTDARFLAFVLVAWFLYALKCEQFFADKLRQKEYTFISVLNLKGTGFVLGHMLLVQIMFFLPVLLYSFIGVLIGIKHHWYTHAVIVVSFNLVICFAAAWRYDILISKYGIGHFRSFSKIALGFSNGSYLNFIFQYLWNRLKVLFLTVKIFSCILLYGMLYNPIRDESDMNMLLLFYGFAVLGHGVLIYKIRQMEELNLNFYRTLPVSLVARMTQYAVLYLILLIPEMIVIFERTPLNLNYHNSLLLAFYGYGILLLLNSVLFVSLVRPFDYLKIISGIYLAIFIAVLTALSVPFIIGLFLISVYIIFQHYYGFELLH